MVSVTALSICSLKDKDRSLISHQATVSSMWSTQGSDPQWITNHFVLFLSEGGSVRGIKRIGGRSKSNLSSAVLSLQALIRCCQCPLTDVFAQRSGPGSHAATTPPDTQLTQQQQLHKHRDWVMPKPIASLSAIHSSIHPSSHPPIPPSACWLTLLWSLFTTRQTDSCPSLFGRKVRLNSRLKFSDESNWVWPGFVTRSLHSRAEKIQQKEHFSRAVAGLQLVS